MYLGRKELTVMVIALCVGVIPAVAWADDPFVARQWALDQIRARAGWDVSRGAGVRIGIVDSGVDLGHEDLAGKIVAHTSCVETAGDPTKCDGSGQDVKGHGTHVAGIAAAYADNGKGIAGVAPDAELVVAKVLNASGEGSGEDTKAGIMWVVDHGATVVNLSLAHLFLARRFSPYRFLEEGVEYAWARGAVVVLAAGNDNKFRSGVGSLDYGDLNGLIVGATGRDDRVACYSSPTGNAKWALLAPGGAAECGNALDENQDVFSTWWREGESNQYAFKVGTSMAAPHVAGAAALLLAKGYTPQATVDRLLASADANVDCGSDSPTCRGRLDIERALRGEGSNDVTGNAAPGRSAALSG